MSKNRLQVHVVKLSIFFLSINFHAKFSEVMIILSICKIIGSHINQELDDR
ncbi:hypothetical protein GLOIN_2v1498953 [Rhizophagus irregularis DAOM 181602=DAOM 197198]|nr:hypothetical protein GLOIN_2v1498953 [Rhizophagus irregularis DAOM 181602=DAOM 197198]